MGKYYIVHYPSYFGMGSNVDIRLVTEENLRKIIRNEIMKKEAGEGYDDRFTGTWYQENYCNSENIEEIIEDVIQKRLNTCSTYAHVNDLVELPESVPVQILEEKMEKKIFRIYNQWMSPIDIIVGEGKFIRYRIDLTKNKKRVGLTNGSYYEFVGYQLKNVTAKYSSQTYKEAVKSAKASIKRMERKLAGLPPQHKGVYIDDIMPEIGIEEWYKERIASNRATIEKFQKMRIMADEYDSYMYENPGQKNWEETKAEKIKNEKVDYTKLVYQYPLFCDRNEFALEVTGKEAADRYISYEELFQKGCGIRYLMADIADSCENGNEFGKMDMDIVLASTFAVD